jgi:hypothetical protein
MLGRCCFGLVAIGAVFTLIEGVLRTTEVDRHGFGAKMKHGFSKTT